MATKTINRIFSRVIILVCLLIKFNFYLFSQDYSFREYGVKDGLPQSQGNIIFQDSKGFLWISTGNGLSRFDGIEFVNYFRKDGLPSNYVFQIIEDRGHDLYALTIKGISKYTGDGFLFYPPGSGFDGTLFFGHAALTDRPDEYLILYNRGGEPANRISSFQNGTYKDYSSEFVALDTMRFMQIYYDSASSELLMIDSNSQLWVWKNEALVKISDDKLSGLHYDRGKILVLRGDSVLEYTGRKLIPHLRENKEGRPEVWLTVSDKINILNFFNGFNTIPIPLEFKINGTFIDRDGSLWLNTENNIYRFLSSAFTTLHNEELRRKNIWAICRDRSGHLWLGTLYGELYEFDGSVFTRRDEYKSLFPGSCAFYKGSRLLSNGEMWLSTNMGILVWNGSAFSRIKGIPDNTQICYIYEDPVDHKILVGTGTGLYIIDKGSVNVLPGFHDGELGVVEGITRDDAGFYWLSGHRGIVKLDGSDAIPVKEDILPEAFTYNIDKDSRGGIWVSTDEGLFYKGNSDEFFRHGLPYQFNKPANTLKILDDSLLLVGRATDICLIDLDRFYKGDKNYFRSYNGTDGYPGGDCLDNGIVKDHEGVFWILTSDNVVNFVPGEIKKNPIPPEVSVNGFFYETDTLSWQPVTRGMSYFNPPSNIVLHRMNNRIRITFSGISTLNSEKVQYIHRLAGLENTWSLPAVKREVIYNNLQPGRYSFMLKAINADGAETPEPVIITFRIKPAYWETAIFKISFLVLSVVISVLLTGYFVKRNQRQKVEKERINSELLKLQISSVLKEFDPHFTFNAISSIGYLIMMDKKDEAYDYLARLSSLLRATLYDGSAIIKTVSEELDFVRNYFELQKLRFGESLTCNIIVGEDVDIQKELPKMSIQTFVENAIKHGFSSRKEGGIIDVILKQEAGFLKILVSDNGIGRTASRERKTGGTGYGIKTVKRIFDIMNQHNQMKASVEVIDIVNGNIAAGTKVIVSIPDSYIFKTGK